MQTCCCEAVVLSVTDYRESDKLITLFTREHGRIRGIARGAKRSVRRFGGVLELFARLNAQLVLHEGLSSLREADVLTAYRHIRQDLLKIGLAGYACELVDHLAAEGMANSRLYRLLVAYLERLDTVSATAADRRFFEVNLLNVLGYRPPLDHCSTCGEDVAPGTAPRVVGPAGALDCRDCRGPGRIISAGAILFLDRSLSTSRFGFAAPSPGDLEDAGYLLDSAISAHLCRPLKSLEFLRELPE